jgi:pimeloyl-ACP methyl ester carboxylesterase
MKLDTVLDHYETIIRGLDRPPMIGHSFGGAFALMLAHRDLGRRRRLARRRDGAWDPRPAVLDAPLGLRDPAQPLRPPQGGPVLVQAVRYAFGNTLDEAAARAAYDRYAIPGARNVLLKGVMANTNPRTPFRVDISDDDRARLLFIGGGGDHVVPPKVSAKIARKYRNSNALAAYKEFPGRSHFTAGEPGCGRSPTSR